MSVANGVVAVARLLTYRRRLAQLDACAADFGRRSIGEPFECKRKESRALD